MSESVFISPNILSEKLSNAEYNRERFAPEFKDNFYVHLSDVRMFLDSYKDDTFERLLDFGCGGSPYRPLFKAKSYIRADHVDCGNLDYMITAEGKIEMPDNSCDVVLSTQVLEHVIAPSKYLSEAFRVLRPGGKLILTTHGIWEDHGVPYDFRRWTYDGLNRELEEVGFQVTKLARLTTGPRAIVFLFAPIIYQLTDPILSISGWAFRLLRHSRFVDSESRHKWMDRLFAKNRIVYGTEPGHGIYLGLGIEGLKP